MHAISRLVLDLDIPNLQVSWVKEGEKLAQLCLEAGANDFGGTLINESISTSAGAKHGQLLSPSSIRRLIREAGGVPQQRSTLYNILEPPPSSSTKTQPLNVVADPDQLFGSFERLTQDRQFSFRRRPR